MNTTEYPADWDLVEEGAAEQAGDYLNKKAFAGGVKMQLRIVSGPLAIGTINAPQGKPFEFPDPKDSSKTKKRYSVRVPFKHVIPGYKTKSAYVFEVLLLDGPQAGSHKIWEVGQTIADQLKAAREVWKDIKAPAFTVWKTGEKLETEWHCVAGPASVTDEKLLQPQFDLKDKITYATAEEIALLPTPEAKPQPRDTMDSPLTMEQFKFIGDLATQKDQSLAQVEKMAERKFGKNDIEKLTRAEAQKLIDVLKAL